MNNPNGFSSPGDIEQQESDGGRRPQKTKITWGSLEETGNGSVDSGEEADGNPMDHLEGADAIFQEGPFESQATSGESVDMNGDGGLGGGEQGPVDEVNDAIGFSSEGIGGDGLGGEEPQKDISGEQAEKGPLSEEEKAEAVNKVFDKLSGHVVYFLLRGMDGDGRAKYAEMANNKKKRLSNNRLVTGIRKKGKGGEQADKMIDFMEEDKYVEMANKRIEEFVRKTVLAGVDKLCIEPNNDEFNALNSLIQMGALSEWVGGEENRIYGGRGSYLERDYEDFGSDQREAFDETLEGFAYVDPRVFNGWVMSLRDGKRNGVWYSSWDQASRALEMGLDEFYQRADEEIKARYKEVFGDVHGAEALSRRMTDSFNRWFLGHQ